MTEALGQAHRHARFSVKCTRRYGVLRWTTKCYHFEYPAGEVGK